MEKYRGQEDLQCATVDLEKVYDKVPTEEVWHCISKSRMAKYMKIVQDMRAQQRRNVQ